jgi:3-oxoacyl-[acyl-carrier protein] reductase
MDLGLNDHVALVAGGTAGLGLAVGRALASEGAAVALAGRREALAAEEAGGFTRGLGVAMDITDPASIAAAVARTEAELGTIDILILNSGGPPASTAANLDVDALRAAGELLLYGPFRLVQATLPKMREKGWGRIIGIGSTVIQQPQSNLAASSMFRASIASYLKLIAEEVATDGVTVNMVLPGRFGTDRTAQIDALAAKNSGRSVAEIEEASRNTIPLGRYGAPDEFGVVAAFLCSESARYLTGEQVRVDGGLVRAL